LAEGLGLQPVSIPARAKQTDSGLRILEKAMRAYLG
jgi:hypothetical protein